MLNIGQLLSLMSFGRMLQTLFYNAILPPVEDLVCTGICM